MNKKEKIFSKLNLNMKDYNEELEIILDKKKFNEEAQNLILSMFYKIENSYKDYYEAKKEVPAKEEFIQNIIFSIEKYCRKIEIIKPTGKKKAIEYKLNKKKGEIKCFPNEVVLLYCLIKLMNRNNEKIELKEKAVNEMLEIGNSLNYQEVIRDFNGWAWTDSNMPAQEIQYNLIYQNLLLLVGYDKIKKIYESEEELFQIKRELENSYKKELVREFLWNISQLSVLLKSNRDKDYKIALINEFEPYVQELEKLSDKEKLIVYITDQKKKIIKKIKKIDKLINNITELKNDFEERNKKLSKDKRIFSISSLAETYEQERRNLLERLKEYNKLVEPMEYLKKKDELTGKTEFYQSLELQEEKKNPINKNIIELQRVFLKIFEEKINNCKEKKEIVHLLYNFRYYMLLNYKKGYKIKDSSKLKSSIEQILKKLLNKAEELKAIETISNDSSCNIKIFGKILQEKIITFDSVVLHIIDEGEKSRIQYYDANVLEGELEIKTDKINTKKKRVKLFI